MPDRVMTVAAVAISTQRAAPRPSSRPAARLPRTLAPTATALSAPAAATATPIRSISSTGRKLARAKYSRL